MELQIADTDVLGDGGVPVRSPLSPSPTYFSLDIDLARPDRLSGD